MARDLNKDEPAFPRDWAHPGHNGMSLRDYFAGQALLEWSSTVVLGEDDSFNKAQMRTIAGICYGFADAMLAERNK